MSQQCGLAGNGDWWCCNVLGHIDSCIPRVETQEERVNRITISVSSPPLEPPMMVTLADQRWMDRMRSRYRAQSR